MPIIFRLFVVSVQFAVNVRNRCYDITNAYEQLYVCIPSSSRVGVQRPALISPAPQEKEGTTGCAEERVGGGESKVSLRYISAFSTNKAEDGNG